MGDRMTLRHAKKAAVVVLATATIGLGTAGVAGAATTGPGRAVAHRAAAHSAAAHRAGCARASRTLARIIRGEATIRGRLTKLQAAEDKATNAGRTRLATFIERRITALQRTEARSGVVAATIQARCPGVSPGTSDTTNGSNGGASVPA